MRRLLAACLVSIVLGGCGIRGAVALVARLHARSVRLPFWQQSDTLELADTSVEFADRAIAGHLAPPNWKVGYGSDGQAQLEYGPLPLESLNLGRYLESGAGWGAAASVQVGGAAAAASNPILGFAGSSELVFDVLGHLEKSGIQSLTQADISSGSLGVSIVNPLARTVELQVAVPGLTRATDGQGVSLALPVGPESSGQTTIDLSHTIFEPDASGDLVIWLKASSEATRKDSAVGGDLAVSIRASRFELSAISGSFNVTQVLASKSVAFSVPSELAQALSPASASVTLRIDNSSAIAGEIRPHIEALGPSGHGVALSVEPAAIVTSRPFTGTFAARATSDLTLDSGNSTVLGLLAPGLDRLVARGTFQAGGDNVTVTASDAIRADLDVIVPLAFRISPFGAGTPLPPIALDPPVQIALSGAARKFIRRSLSRLSLIVTADNGWQIPLDVALVFSTTLDPASDPGAYKAILHLGDGSRTQSTVALDAQQSRDLADFQTMGVELSSSGSAGRILRLHASDALRLRVVATVGVEVTPS